MNGDPIGQWLLDAGDFGTLTDAVKNLAQEHSGGRLVSVLEGGYDRGGLAAAAGEHVKRLCG
jgi:acetoin utilization deacetylase AcuC-like enzyme